ncbi:uncharacterized protein LOC144773375 [Lissotriton helveticus]
MGIAQKPKQPRAIRLCIDMRLPNKAIRRECHITPTMDDIITDVNGSKWFSKIDLNAGYHQLQLSEESRYIITFSTHLELWRYKRLNFGISSAAEVFQNTIREMLSGLSAGGETCALVYVAPGGPALLQLSDSEVAGCSGICDFDWTKNTSKFVAKIRNGVEVRKCRPNCQAFPSGSLELSEVTPEDTGDYRVEAWLRNQGIRLFSRCFRLQVQEPVSVPAVNYTCRPNASVQLSCSVENGTDPTYSWSLDETPSWTPTKGTLRGYQSVLRHVTCSARNEISEQRSDPTDITCPDPVSVPEVTFKCSSKGTVQLFCRVANGTDLSFSWTVNGTEEDKRTSPLEIPIGNEFIEVNCTARNQISESASKRTNITCMVAVSEPEVKATCDPNGNVRLICVLANGTAPSYSWSVNWTQQTASGQELTIDASVMLTATCTASNMISQRKSKPVNVTCTGGGACECRSRCILWSSLVGAGLLILIALPLVIDCLYPVPR